MKLKVGKSPGPDQLHPRMLRELASVLKIPLFILFRKSLDKGQLPMQWKCAHVSPIFKKGSRSSPCNYRPVSLTSVVYKLLATLIRDSLVTHMEDNHLVCQQQHGFCAGRSTTTQMPESCDCSTLLFADVTKIFQQVISTADCEKLQADLNDLPSWADRWQMLSSFIHKNARSCGLGMDTRNLLTR